MKWVRDTWNQAEGWVVFPMSIGKLGTPFLFFGRDGTPRQFFVERGLHVQKFMHSNGTATYREAVNLFLTVPLNAFKMYQVVFEMYPRKLGRK